MRLPAIVLLTTIAVTSCASPGISGQSGSNIAAASADRAASGPIVSEPVATTDTGIVTGAIEGPLNVFRGIPYARAPVGEWRWRPPQPVDVWTGKRRSTEFGPACLQPPFAGLNDELSDQDEDCLTLNVWAPRTGTKRPVMVWLHGGGHLIGSGKEPFYWPEALVQRGVVVVTLNYRLGRLGFFAHPAITQQASLRNEPTGNFGIMDQIAALKWVQQNIASFGGDPDRVTVFGESAGGRSVNWLMSSPASEGLFSGAISQSGRAMEPLRGMDIKRFGQKPASEIDAAVVKSLRAEPDPAILRSIPADKLIQPYMEMVGQGFGPFVDGKIIVNDPAAVFAAGEQQDVPFMIGVNSWEASLIASNPPPLASLLAVMGEAAPQIAKLYPGDEKTATLQLFQDAVYNSTLKILAARMAPVNVSYAYYFDYVPAFRKNAVPGAAHGAEIPYVFGTYVNSRNAKSYLPEDAAMSELMQKYWVNFASTGNPNGAGLPIWPIYNPSDDVVMRLGRDLGPLQGLRKQWVDAQIKRIERVYNLPPAQGGPR